ncbi:lysM domain-containing protein [Colletotrichum spaethianum]|uniref:LysM domain-containing protein n=1 Tax=Colletotrichum spaethianum TaxID=700344 RepID=A0AA37P9I7_9PEZI|nr:lysM domain-containing protein [Colletotrichum spaethianum]GKT48129.1 lysM domain-containing protein [Colletotrichum spaethianum]
MRTTPVPEQTEPAAEDLPKQESMASDCTSFWLVSSADTCSSIASQGDITLADFKAWNPAAEDACDCLEPDFYVCVGWGAGTNTGKSSSATVPSTTTTSGAVATPTPIQDGMVSGRNEMFVIS